MNHITYESGMNYYTNKYGLITTSNCGYFHVSGIMIMVTSGYYSKVNTDTDVSLF